MLLGDSAASMYAKGMCGAGQGRAGQARANAAADEIPLTADRRLVYRLLSVVAACSHQTSQYAHVHTSAGANSQRLLLEYNIVTC